MLELLATATAIPIAVTVVMVVIPVMFCVDDSGQAKKDELVELSWIFIPSRLFNSRVTK